MSTGSEVVCAALVTVDFDGSRTVEYRTVSADRQANADMGDLVTSAIELMTSMIPGHRSPDAIAVTYRSEDHAAEIRSAFMHTTREVRLVPESAAALAHLTTTGLVDGYDSIALIDLGASGLSVTVTDRTTGTVSAQGRSDVVSGNALDSLVKNLVQDMTRDNLRDDIRDDRGIGSARYRSIKEQLTREDDVRIERYTGLPLTVTRDAFDTAATPIFDTAAQFARGVFGDSAEQPEAIVVIGGGAQIPLLAATLGDRFQVPVIRLPEPDAVLAVGVATVAASSDAYAYRLVPATHTTARRVSRYSGAIAAAVVAGGLVLAYGVQTMTPADDPGVSPVGSVAESAADTATDVDLPVAEGVATGNQSPTPGRTTGERSDAPPTSFDSTGSSARVTSSAPPTTTPTLRPAPDLPSIEWPIDPTSVVPSPGDRPGPSLEPPPAATTVPTPPSEPESSPEPSESAPISTQPTPEPTPESTPEYTPVPTESISIPTTDTGASAPTPELTAPPTVWSPPVSTPEESGLTTAPRSSTESMTEPAGSVTQTPQPGT
ncbi:Hsp70 family protein [Rhodococcus sp. NPDC078407]|uniref:Hsp70 family protein n=1 Tax=Rhodococcus sp. NPDC078407 TaxID=3364509 RepID=UPI0037CB5E39